MKKVVALGLFVIATAAVHFTFAATPPRVTSITATPRTGTYYQEQTVFLNTTTPGAQIYYTTDGRTPTPTSTPYGASTGIRVDRQMTIRAVAVKSGLSNSSLFSGRYTLKVKTPVFTPHGGTYRAVQTITLASTTTGADIYFTFDGKVPTVASTKYSTPFTLDKTTLVRVKAFKSGFTDSTMTSASFRIVLPPPPPPTPSSTLVIPSDFSSAPAATPHPWKALLLVYPFTDFTYVKSGTHHFVGAMTQAEMQKIVSQFQSFPGLAASLSNGGAGIEYDVKYITRPISALSAYGTGYWLSPDNVRIELNKFAQNNSGSAKKYDSIFVAWKDCNFGVICIPTGGAWGLSYNGPQAISNGATYHVVFTAPDYLFGSPAGAGGVWLHEWLHGSTVFYQNKGYPMPQGNADGGGLHGYPSGEAGDLQFYHDLMTGNVLDAGTRKGITPAAWQSGSVFH